MLLSGRCKPARVKLFRLTVVHLFGVLLLAGNKQPEQVSDVTAFDLILEELCQTSDTGKSSRHSDAIQPLRVEKLENGIAIRCTSSEPETVRRLHDWADVVEQRFKANKH